MHQLPVKVLAQVEVFERERGRAWVTAVDLAAALEVPAVAVEALLSELVRRREVTRVWPTEGPARYRRRGRTA
jgi:hypothetical protein